MKNENNQQMKGRQKERCVGKESAESDNYMDFPVVMYGYERWTIRKAEH